MTETCGTLGCMTTTSVQSLAFVGMCVGYASFLLSAMMRASHHRSSVGAAVFLLIVAFTFQSEISSTMSSLAFQLTLISVIVLLPHLVDIVRGEEDVSAFAWASALAHWLLYPRGNTWWTSGSMHTWLVSCWLCPVGHLSFCFLSWWICMCGMLQLWFELAGDPAEIQSKTPHSFPNAINTWLLYSLRCHTVHDPSGSCHAAFM